MTSAPLTLSQRQALGEILSNEDAKGVSFPNDLYLKVVTLQALERRGYVKGTYTTARWGRKQRRALEFVRLTPAGFEVARSLSG